MRYIKLASAVIALILSTSASAALIDHDSYTTDTTTGLNWLDLSETLDRSYSDVSQQFGAEGDFQGYRYATVEEARTFFSNAGVAGVVNGFQSYNYQPIVDLASMLGYPLTSAPYELRGVLGEFQSTYNGIDYWKSYVLIADHNLLTGVIASSSTGSDYSMSRQGHFLVSTVPVPAAVWLFGSGLIGLIGVARRRKT